MTNNQKLQTLNYVIELAYWALQDMEREDMETQRVKTLLENIYNMEWMVDRFRKEDHTVVPEPAPERQEPVTPAPAAPAPAPAPTAPAESKYSMTDVRAALAKARSNGISVSDIIRSFGVDNFTALDASKYPTIMEKLAEEEKRAEEKKLAAKGAV